jgi:hypothetical protein
MQIHPDTMHDLARLRHEETLRRARESQIAADFIEARSAERDGTNRQEHALDGLRRIARWRPFPAVRRAPMSDA